MPTQDQISPGFGANEWMVEEMRAAWSADPSSVSPQWRELFETDPSAGLHQPGPASFNGSASSAAGGPRRATITPQAASTLRRSSAVQDVTRGFGGQVRQPRQGSRRAVSQAPGRRAPSTSPVQVARGQFHKHRGSGHPSTSPVQVARGQFHKRCHVFKGIPSLCKRYNACRTWYHCENGGIAVKTDPGEPHRGTKPSNGAG